MAHPYFHSLSSVKRWGGTIEDYLPVHRFLDSSKELCPDFRHRALYHHAGGIFLCERLFGTTITNSTGREIPVRWIAERHILEDLGQIPTVSDWLRCLRPEPWMGRTQKLDVEVEHESIPAVSESLEESGSGSEENGSRRQQ